MLWSVVSAWTSVWPHDLSPSFLMPAPSLIQTPKRTGATLAFSHDPQTMIRGKTANLLLKWLWWNRNHIEMWLCRAGVVNSLTSEGQLRGYMSLTDQHTACSYLYIMNMEWRSFLHPTLHKHTVMTCTNFNTTFDSRLKDYSAFCIW